MYIIDRNKDYYDHYSYIYGVDKKIVYDRRGSSVLNEDTLISLSAGYNPINGKDSVRFLLLEIGQTQYLIKLHDFIFNDSEIMDCSMELVNTFSDYKHRFSTPVSIRGVQIGWNFNWKYWKDINKRYKYKTTGSYDEVIVKLYDNEIKNPILANTRLTSLLNSDTVWRDIQNYISSLDNDVDCSTPITDVEKAEVHGFDKKTSFRNPIK